MQIGQQHLKNNNTYIKTWILQQKYDTWYFPHDVTETIKGVELQGSSRETRTYQKTRKEQQEHPNLLCFYFRVCDRNVTEHLTQNKQDIKCQ